MAKILRNLKLNDAEFLSIVDKGASGDDQHRPRVVLFKRDKNLREQIQPLKEEVNMPKDVKKQEGVNVDLSSLGLSEEQMAAVLQLLEAAKQPQPAPVQEPVVEAAKPEEEMKAVEPEKEEEKAEEKEEEEMAKRDKLLKKYEAEKEELAKRVAKLEDEKKRAEFMKIAESRPYLPNLKVEEQAEILKSAKETFEDKDYEALNNFLDSVNKTMKESELFKSAGSSAPGRSADVDAIAKDIFKKAKAEGNSKIKNMVLARAEAYKQNPQLLIKE